MTRKRIIPVTKALLATGLVAAGILAGAACTREKEIEVTREVPVEVTVEVPMNLAETAEAIEEGKVDVGTEYGLVFGQRYHNIHATTLGLGCTTCHVSSPDLIQTVFTAQDVSPAAPGPVDKRACLGCHRTGPGDNLYGSGSP